MSTSTSGRSTLKAPGLDWLLMAAALALVILGTLLVWSATSTRDDLTGGETTAYLTKQLVNVAIGVVLMVIVMATDHRWVRIVAPLVYVGSIVGLALVLVAGSTINGSRSWIQLGGMSIQPSEFAKLAVVDRHGAAGRRTHRRALAAPGRLHRGDRHAGDRRHPGCTDPAAARPRHHARARRHRLRGPGRLRRRPALAGRAHRRRHRRRGGRGHRRSAQGLPGRPLPRLHQPRPRPARRRLQRRAGPDRGRQRRTLRPGPLRRLADPLRLRARAAHRLHLHRRRRGARPASAPGC